MTETVLAVRDLCFAWSKSRLPLFQIPEFSLHRQERVFLFGPSGSGKSTLLNLLSGVIPPSQGRIELLGENLAALSSHQRDQRRARHIGVIFQQFNLIPYLSAGDNILLAGRFSLLGQARAVARCRHLALALGLDADILNRPAVALSVGQQQRVAAARALLAEPEIIIADEPTSALDMETRDEFMTLLMSAARESGSAILFVSHDRSLVPSFDRVIDIRQFHPETTSC